MDLLCYELLHSPAGRANADAFRRLFETEPLLRDHAEPWTADSIPPATTLYVLVVIVSDDLAADARLRRRISDVAARGFPVLPIVDSCTNYVFADAPLPAIAERNARGLDTPAEIINTLLHHGGLRRYGTGGQVMISYARVDGSLLKDALRDELEAAGFRCFIDHRDSPGGVDLQTDIAEQIGKSDLVVLVDSKGASKSSWVAEEIDMARAAHVPVIAVTPTDSAQHHALPATQVPWEPEADISGVASRAANLARRMFARKLAFQERVSRSLEQLSKLRGWDLVVDGTHLLVRPNSATIRVACSEAIPGVEAVTILRALVGEGGSGLLVGGTRPYPRVTAEGLDRAGRPTVRVAPLSCVAARVTGGVKPNALAGQRIFLSAAMPDEQAQKDAAMLVLASFVVTFTQTMFELGATLVFGGHPSVTPLIHRSCVDYITDISGKIELHQGRYWLAEGELPDVVKNPKIFANVQFHGHGQSPADDLEALREGMITDTLRAAVFVGGVTENPIGGKPGVIEEYERFRRVCPTRPAFVLGLAEGAARQLIENPQPSLDRVSPIIAKELAETKDPDLATALVVAELLGR